MDGNSLLRYRIFDPTGNITALVESVVAEERQPSVAAALMHRHPEVEQVGYVRFEDGVGADPAGKLRMAGGEFCGNASMCAAALLRQRRENAGLCSSAEETAVCLRVSGAARPVALRLRRETEESFRCAVCIPPARAIRELPFAFEGLRDVLAAVELEGISHIILEPGSPLYALRTDREAAGRAVRAVCAALEAAGAGLMFLDRNGTTPQLTPLVYIPGSGTEFWENSCASGSAAVGMLLAARSGGPVRLSLQEPGGSLHISSEPNGETWLNGSVRLVSSWAIPIPQTQD